MMTPERMAEIRKILDEFESIRAGIGCELLTEVDLLTAENVEVKSALMISEKYRRAYQNGKGELYAMGGKFCEAAMKYLPCGEGSIDRYGDRIERENSPRLLAERNVLVAENAELRAGIAEVRCDAENVDDALAVFGAKP